WFRVRFIGSDASRIGRADEFRAETDQQPVHRALVRHADRLLVDRALLRPRLGTPAAGLVAVGLGGRAGAHTVGEAVAGPVPFSRVYGDCPGFDQRRRGCVYRPWSPRTPQARPQPAPISL